MKIKAEELKPGQFFTCSCCDNKGKAIDVIISSNVFIRYDQLENNNWILDCKDTYPLGFGLNVYPEEEFKARFL